MRTLACLLASLTAAPAAGLPWRREALARWGFDDISVRDARGSRRASVWSQAYDAGARGSLLVPAAGDLELRGGLTDGFDVGQAVNTPDARRKSLTWAANADLFSPRLRGLVQFSPNLSWSQSQEAANNDAPSRVRKQESGGFSSGLSLPGLPSFSLSRGFSRSRDPSSVSPLDEKGLSASENLGWSRGAFRLALERRSSALLDVTGGTERRLSETRQGRVDYQRFGLKKLGLQALSLRSAVLATKTQGELREKDLTADASLRSLPLVKGRWQHSAGASSSYYRNAITGGQTDVSAADLLSNMETRWGAVSNSLATGLALGAGTSRTVSEAFSFTERFRKGRLALSQSLSSGWSDGSGGPASRSDGAAARVSLIPRPGQNLSVGFQAATARSLGGGPSSLTQKGDAAANIQLRRDTRLNLGFEQDRQRGGDTGIISVSDRASLGLEAAPRQSVRASLHAATARTRTNRGTANQASSASLNLSWLPTRRLSLNAQGAVAGRSLNLGAGLSWTAGKTALGLSYARQEISTTQFYSHLNVSLTRAF
ncbi:MAG: hypothetical protein HYZ75_10815 [Elusimicrobia bacterium]|nr:hypothetical protein [Elusimicrobiota bacterium]